MSVRDPGAAHGDPPKPLLPPCANCGHAASIHAWVKGTGRTSCSKAWATGRCGCKRFTERVAS